MMLKTEDKRSNEEMQRREKRVARRFKGGYGEKVFGSPSEKFGLAERYCGFLGCQKKSMTLMIADDPKLERKNGGNKKKQRATTHPFQSEPLSDMLAYKGVDACVWVVCGDCFKFSVVLPRAGASSGQGRE